MTTTSSVDPRSARRPSPDEDLQLPHQHYQEHHQFDFQQQPLQQLPLQQQPLQQQPPPPHQRKHPSPSRQLPPEWPLTADIGAGPITPVASPSPSPVPGDEHNFHVQQNYQPPVPQKTRPPPVNRTAIGVRRMSSVPELGQSQRVSKHGPGRSQSRRDEVTGGTRGWGDDRYRRRGPYENGGHRLLRQKSIERGIVGVPPPRPSPQNGRRIPSNGTSGSNSRPGSRPTSRNDTHPHTQQMPQGRAAPPGLKMPLAFNSMARERAFSPNSQPPFSRMSPMQGATPDLYENRQRAQHHRDPPRSHPYAPQPPFSATTSASTSPHNSFAFSYADEIRSSVRSALSASDQNRSSGFTTSSETPTDSSNAMTVDEAIGMYGSDTDDDEMYTSGQESEHRRSKGDSVLGGPRSRQGSYSSCSYRQKGDSVLGGETSPETRSRHSDQEERLKEAMGGNGSHGSTSSLGSQNDDYSTIHHVPTSPMGALEISERTDSIEQTENTESTEAEGAQPFSAPVKSLLDVDVPATRQEPEPVKPPRARAPTQYDEPPPARDRYGFRKQTQYITLQEYEEWEVRYNETLDRRRKKWDQLMRESGLTPGEEGPVRFPPKSTKIKRYIRKGIPPEWRGAAWFWYAGGQRYLNKYPGLYDELVRKGPPPPDSELIERDLHRTFPDNIKFKPDPPPGDARFSKQQEKQETPIVMKLRRVLVAFAVYVPKIGYCQSLNFLAGLLLLFMSEEKSFWMLYILTQTHLPGTHEMNLEGSSVDQWVLMTSVRDSLPQIWQKIGGGLDGSEVELNSTKLPPVTLCTSSWFMSGFIGSLPIETILRVWDCLFYEGSKTLFRIALTVFKTGEGQIKAVHDPMEIFQVVQTIPRKLIDAGALIEACYRRRNGFGHLSQESIDERRQERRNVFAEERALIARGERLSKDDGALRGAFERSGNTSHHHELGKKFRKILVKT